MGRSFPFGLYVFVKGVKGDYIMRGCNTQHNGGGGGVLKWQGAESLKGSGHVIVSSSYNKQTHRPRSVCVCVRVCVDVGGVEGHSCTIPNLSIHYSTSGKADTDKQQSSSEKSLCLEGHLFFLVRSVAALSPPAAALASLRSLAQSPRSDMNFKRQVVAAAHRVAFVVAARF